MSHLRKSVSVGMFLVAMGCGVAVSLPAASPSEAATFSPKVKSILVNGKLSSRPYGIVQGGTTYMPIWYVMKVLTQLGIKNTWDGTTWMIATPSYMPVDLTNIKHGVAPCIITLNGKTVSRVSRIVFKDPYSHVATSYMPIWYIMQLLNRLGIGSEWKNGSEWRITTPPPINLTVADSSLYPTLYSGTSGYPVVLLQQKLNAAGYNVGSIDGKFGYATTIAVKAFQAVAGILVDGIVSNQTWLALNQCLAVLFTQPTASNASSPPPNAATANSGRKTVQVWATNGYSMTDAEKIPMVTQVNNDSYNLNGDGTVSDYTNGNDTLSQLVNDGLNRNINSTTHNVNVFATVTNISSTTHNFDGAFTSTVLNDSATRTSLETNLVNVAVQDGYKGIDIDFESLKPSEKDAFIQFLSELANQLHAAHKELSVTLPAETGAVSEPWTGAYNYAAIGNIADVVPIMAYDFSWQGSAPGAIAPLFWDEQILKYATSVMPPSKILMGLAAYGYDWDTSAGGNAKACSMSTIDAITALKNIAPVWDSTDSVPYFTYSDASGDSHIVYYENQASIQQKLSLVNQFEIAGVAVWKAGLENQEFRDALLSWTAQNAN